MSGFSLSVLIATIFLGVLMRLIQRRADGLEKTMTGVRGNLRPGGSMATLLPDRGRLLKALLALFLAGAVFFLYLGFVVALLVGVETAAAATKAVIASLYEALKGIRIEPADRVIAGVLLLIGLLDFSTRSLKPWLSGRKLARQSRLLLENRLSAGRIWP